MKNSLFSGAAVIALGAALVTSAPALAEDSDQAAPAAAPTSNAMTTPALAGPLAANPNPASFDAGPVGKIYATGVVSGFGQWQSNHVPGDRSSQADLSNGQAIIQTTEGLVQFYVQAGAYSLPSLGTGYIRASKAIDDFYGVMPVAYAKLAPTDTFSIQAGKLPTLIGAEYTFTFQNSNIERGLLWNQENAVARGVQANYTAGPLAFSLALSDGFYSDRYNWLSGLVTYTIDPANTIAFDGGGNVDKTNVSTLATPLLQNNSQIYNLMYTYNAAPWTVAPYLQYTYVPTNKSLGITHDASTFGAAILGTYAFPDLDGVSLPVRAEYITSSGSATDGTPNLLYGAGSEAWSLTVTPTYQKGIFYARAEASYVDTMKTVAGSAFGTNGNAKSQVRVLAEVGVLF